MSVYKHFKNVEFLELPDKKSVDLLIENNNVLLMTVLEERIGMSRGDPHAISTPLGCESPLKKEPVKVCRVQASVDLNPIPSNP